MLTTINISLPSEMYAKAKQALPRRGYASISEFIRAALRDILYTQPDEEEFSPEFTAQVLKAAKSSRKNDIVLKTEKDIDNFFLHFKKPDGSPI